MREIVWTKFALQDFEQNLIYLNENWEQKVIQKFTLKVEKTIKLIQANPNCFQKHKRLKCHIVPIMPQITLFYEVIDKKVILLRFWNNYQNLL